MDESEIHCKEKPDLSWAVVVQSQRSGGRGRQISVNSRLAWSIELLLAQPTLQRETMSQKSKKKERKARLKEYMLRARKVAQQLKTCTALKEDVRSLSSTHVR